MAITQDEDELKNVIENLLGPNKKNQTKAMEEEIEFIRSNQVWKLVDLPKGCKAIRNKWVLKIKCKTNNNVESIRVDLCRDVITTEQGHAMRSGGGLARAKK